MRDSRFLKICASSVLITLETLYAYFSRFGEIEFIRSGEASPPSFWAVVAFISVESALFALNSCCHINGISVNVNLCDHNFVYEKWPALRKPDNHPFMITSSQSNRCHRCLDSPTKCHVRVSGLPTVSPSSRSFVLTVLSIKDYVYFRLREAAKVEKVRLVVSRSQQITCLVSFQSCEDCHHLLSSKSIFFMFGKTVTIEHDCNGITDETEVEDILSEGQMEASRTLYVSNIPDRTSKEALRCFFGRYGHVLSVDSVRMPLFAFVQYTDIDSSVRAIMDWRSEHTFGRKLKLNFGKSLRWKTLWLKINAVFTNDDVITHLSRFIKPERFYVDNTNGEMLIWFRRTHEAIAGFKKLRAHQSGGDVLFVVDYSSDRMDKYFFDRSVDIDSVFDMNRGSSSSRRSSSITSQETRNASFEADDKKVSSANYQRGLILANRIVPSLKEAKESELCSYLFSSSVMIYAVDRLSRVKELEIEQLSVKPTGEKKEVVVMNSVYDNHSEESWPDNRKSALVKRKSSDETAGIYKDLFVPEIVIGRKLAKSEGVCETIDNKVKEEEEKVSDGEEFSAAKRKKSLNLIESEEETKPVNGDGLVNHCEISMYDSIKIRRYLSDPNNANPEVPQSGIRVGLKPRSKKRKKKIKSSKRKRHVKDVHSELNGDLPVEEVKEEKISPSKELMKLDLANGSRKKGKPTKVKISTGLSRVLRNNVKLLRHHEAAKNITFKELPMPESPLKEFKEEDEEVKEEPREEEQGEEQEEEEKEQQGEEEIEEETVVPEPMDVEDKHVDVPVCDDPPEEMKQECHDSDSTITAIHEERTCSPLKEEGCPGPPDSSTDEPNITSQRIPQSTPRTTPTEPAVPVQPIVYHSPFVYPGIPQQYYYHPPFYISPVEVIPQRPQNVVDGYVYPNELHNYCLQPVIQQIPGYISQTSMPYSLPYMALPYIRGSHSSTFPRFEGNCYNTVNAPVQPTPKVEVKTLTGVLTMKNASVKVEYHYIAGLYSLAEKIMSIKDLTVPLLRLAQRMHLVKTQIDEVEKRLRNNEKWCSFVVIPQKEADNVSIFSSHFIQYLSLKSAAGIVSYPSRDKNELFPVIYFVPPSEFARLLLNRWTCEDSVFRTYAESFVAIVSDA